MRLSRTYTAYLLSETSAHNLPAGILYQQYRWLLNLHQLRVKLR
jgi:hypothetical protein